MRFAQLPLISFLGLAFCFCDQGHAQNQPVRSSNLNNQYLNKRAFKKPKDGMFGKFQKIEGSLPLHLQADEMIYDNKGNKVIARGNVEVQYEGNNLTADQIIYDQSANTLTASGNVLLNDTNGNIIRAEHYTLTDDFRDGFVQSLSIVAKDDSRISAEQASRKNGNVTEFSNAKFTPCRSDGSKPPLWCVAAQKVTRDEAAGVIRYNDAQFEMFGKPFFYLPYFEHPDPSVKRKSGFLAPNYGSTKDLGAFVEIPYYFALSPSYDFLFHPRYMSDQGILWMGDWRQKTTNGQYFAKLSGMYQDANDLPTTSGFTENDRQALNGFRGSIQTKGDFTLTNWWKYGWNITEDTDDSFRRFYKLDSYLVTDRVNNVYLTGLSDRNYLGVNFYQLESLVYNTPSSTTYTYPIIDYNYIFDNPVLGGELKFVTNSMSFQQPDAPSSYKYPGAQTSRAIAEIKWRRELTDQIGISYTPFAELRGDVYAYNNYINPNNGDFVSSNSVARGLATGGLKVSYPWVAFTGGYSHIVEPIGQIIARQSSVPQSALPNQDAISIVFDDANLFETSKFSGYDRLETGTRANVGFQYTFQNSSGGYAKALFGQSYQLAGDNPYANKYITCPSTLDVVYAPGINYNCTPIFSPTSGLETKDSDFVLGLYLAPSPAFRLISQSRFDNNTFEFRREDAAINVFYGPLTLAGAYSYRYDDYAYNDPGINPQTALQDIGGNLGLRLTDRWSLLGGARYDISGGQIISDSVQLRYLDECFMLSATYLNTNITDPSGAITPDQSIMFRVEYKYLGGYNYKTSVINQLYGDPATINP